MADAKQSHLNGAYYGPSIPPTKSYHRPGRGSGCGCGCCLLSFLFKLIFSAIIIVGLAVLVFWLIFRPTPVKFHVVDASLTEFNLTNSSTLNYNFAVNMTIRNPNKYIGIYYDRIEANAYYGGQRFNTVSLPRFYQGHKNTSSLNPVFNGPSLVVLGASELSAFEAEKSAGVYNIDVKLYLRIRFRLRKIKTGRFKPKIKCDLKVPLSSNGVSAGTSFEPTKCKIDF